VRRITISNLNAWNVASDHGILVAGLPGHPIEEVALSDIRIRYAGGGTSAQAQRVVPELEKAYPEPYIFGVLPSWGLFARHVRDLRLHDVDLGLLSPDARPAVFLQNVSELSARGTPPLADGRHPPVVEPATY
jgi:hypothetical protein